MFELTYDSQFKVDYRRVTRAHPELREELRAAASELVVAGRLPDAYGAHLLDNPGGNYDGHMEFHLSDGRVDVLVLYMPHASNPVIRLVRMGSHEELFRGATR